MHTPTNYTHTEPLPKHLDPCHAEVDQRPLAYRRPTVATARSTRLRDAALAAARELGLYVFPCRPGDKLPNLHGARHCTGQGDCANGHQGWEQRATRDLDRIAHWWNQQPYNIGAAVGRSHLVVIDLDHGRGEPAPAEFPGAASGIDVLEALAERAEQPAPWDTYTVSTPTGGLHLYFRAPPGSNLRNTAGASGSTGLGWKIDTRAQGGFVIAAGSVRREGYYRVVNRSPVADLPHWLTEALTKRLSVPTERPSTGKLPSSRTDAYLRAIVNGEAATVRTTVYGQGRNHALNRAAFNLGRLVGAGELDEHVARQTLLDAASCHFGIHEFTETEARNTITSGLEAGRLRPRHLRRGTAD